MAPSCRKSFGAASRALLSKRHQVARGEKDMLDRLVLARVEDSELADALEQLEGLSDDEVMQLLGVD